MSDEKTQRQEEPESQGGPTSTVATPVRKPAPPIRVPKKLPPYRVLLHNDEVNTFEHVVKSVRRLTVLTSEEAAVRALEAHESGVALLLMTHRERAELYIEQFASLKITVTTEPAES